MDQWDILSDPVSVQQSADWSVQHSVLTVVATSVPQWVATADEKSDLK